MFDLDLRMGRPELCELNGSPVAHDFSAEKVRTLLEDGGFQLIAVSLLGTRWVGEFVGVGAHRVAVGLRPLHAHPEPPVRSLWRRLRRGATT